MKRTICKCCQTPLIPGETARVRLISKPIKGVKWTCLTCTNTKRFPTKKEYKLWIEQPEAVVETLHYTTKSNNEGIQKPNLQETLNARGKSKNNINPKNHLEKISSNISYS